MTIGARPFGSRTFGDSTNQVRFDDAGDGSEVITLRHKVGGVFTDSIMKHKVGGVFTEGVVRHKVGGVFVPTP